MMGAYEIILKAYEEGSRVRIVFKDGRVEPDTRILNVSDEFDFIPSDEYLDRCPQPARDWCKEHRISSADYDDVEKVEAIS